MNLTSMKTKKCSKYSTTRNSIPKINVVEFEALSTKDRSISGFNSSIVQAKLSVIQIATVRTERRMRLMTSVLTIIQSTHNL